VHGRIKCEFQLGDFQRAYLEKGALKESELIRKGKRWFFNVALEISDPPLKGKGEIIAIDVGENNIATTSKGTIYKGSELRHKRDKFLKRRGKLQSNGSRSAKRCLKRISGKERRHVKETNHIISKSLVEDAFEKDSNIIVLEKLTNIRKRIKGNKRMRSRLNRWSWYELQQFIEYKAKAKGINVIYVNPAYTSQTCSICDCLGFRHKHLFKCSNCGSYQHSDRNAAINLLKLGRSVVLPTVQVNVPMVAVS
jgi:IS605 OrfB family transposase